MRQSPSGPLIPNELVRYSFNLTTGMAGTTIDPQANNLGGVPVASPTADPSVFFPVPGGSLTQGTLIVLSLGGNAGDKIDLQWTVATIANPLPTPVGALHKGVIDPTQAAGLKASVIDFSDVVMQDGGVILIPQFILPANLAVNTLLTVIFAAGILWKPSALRDVPV